MRGYRLEDIENVNTFQGRRGYRSESASDQGPAVHIYSTSIKLKC